MFEKKRNLQDDEAYVAAHARAVEARRKLRAALAELETARTEANNSKLFSFGSLRARMRVEEASHAAQMAQAEVNAAEQARAAALAAATPALVEGFSKQIQAANRGFFLALITLGKAFVAQQDVRTALIAAGAQGAMSLLHAHMSANLGDPRLQSSELCRLLRAGVLAGHITAADIPQDWPAYIREGASPQLPEKPPTPFNKLPEAVRKRWRWPISENRY